jgi:hypothetical protein
MELFDMILPDRLFEAIPIGANRQGNGSGTIFSKGTRTGHAVECVADIKVWADKIAQQIHLNLSVDNNLEYCHCPNGFKLFSATSGKKRSGCQLGPGLSVFVKYLSRQDHFSAPSTAAGSIKRVENCGPYGSMESFLLVVSILLVQII